MNKKLPKINKFKKDVELVNDPIVTVGVSGRLFIVNVFVTTL
jgi:hypothetical protein